MIINNTLIIEWTLDDVLSVFEEHGYHTATEDDCIEILEQMDKFTPDITWQLIEDLVENFIMERR